MDKDEATSTKLGNDIFNRPEPLFEGNANKPDTELYQMPRMRFKFKLDPLSEK